MKKLLLLLALAVFVAGSVFVQEGSPADAISKASTVAYYAKSSLTGDALWQAIESRSGAFSVATVNPNGTPNAAVVIPGISKDRTALFFGIAPNQTLENIKNKKLAVLTIYLYNATASDKFERNKGARIILELITDQAEITRLVELNKDRGASATSIFMKIVKVLPLG